MRDLATQLGRILDANLTDAQLEKVLYHNGMNLFGLS
jgi:hypothetical protein